jgi:DNA-directed RNA polymerase specialized sigma subunit
MYKNDTFFRLRDFLMDYEKALMALPDRELWIWLMYRMGYTQKYIGVSLGVTQSDVAYHIARILKYLARWVGYEKGLWGKSGSPKRGAVGR